MPTGPSRRNSKATSTPPTSARSSETSPSASGPPAPRRPRGASNGSGAPCKIASSSSSACAGSRPARRPTPSSPSSCADYNRRFAHPPTDAHAAWRPRPRDFADQLSCRYTRVVAPDNTVRLGTRWVQIPPGPYGRSYAGRRVDLRECVDGRLLVVRAGRRLVSQPTPGPDFVLTPRSKPHAERTRRLRASRIASEEGGRHPGIPQKPPSRPSARRPTPTVQAARPAATHPWRRSFRRRRTPHRGDILTGSSRRHPMGCTHPPPAPLDAAATSRSPAPRRRRARGRGWPGPASCARRRRCR